MKRSELTPKTRELLNRIDTDLKAAIADWSEDGSLAFWELSTSPAEKALEWFIAKVIEEEGQEACVRAVSAVALAALPVAEERGAEEAAAWDWQALFEDDADPDERWISELAAKARIQRIAAFVADPTEINRLRVANSRNDSRQLAAWDEDANPGLGLGWIFILEVGELAVRTVAGPTTTYQKLMESQDVPFFEDRPETWPYDICGRRAAVCALKSISEPDDDPDERAELIFKAVSRAFPA